MITATEQRTPDFIICGAMKCGTTSLHHILDQDPQVFIPPGELHFFDVDDIHEHPDFFAYRSRTWNRPDYINDFERCFEWYRSQFQPAMSGQMLGEDSTGYLASHRAPARIHDCLPDAKLVVMLRDPASRAYSQYWHEVRTGRETLRFEESIQFPSTSLIRRSCYREQVERYLSCFSPQQMHFVLFEQFVREPEETINGVRSFLGLNGPYEKSASRSHQNRGSAPFSLSLKLWQNRLFRHVSKAKFLGRYPTVSIDTDREWPANGELVQARQRSRRTIPALLARTLGKVNPLIRKIPPMRIETRRFLNSVLQQENDGLSKLIGLDVSAYWYRDK